MKNLKNFEFNRCEKNKNHLHGLDNLKSLTVDTIGKLNGEFSNLPNLKELYLFSVELDDKFEFKSFEKVEKLTIYHVVLTTKNLKQLFQNLTNLKSL